MALHTQPRPIVGIDIGGTLMKMVLEDGTDAHNRHPLVSFIRNQSQQADTSLLPAGWRRTTFSRPVEGSSKQQFWALLIPTADIEQMMAAVEAQGPATGGRLRVAATGGGVLKHKDDLERRLGVDLAVVKELPATAHGLLIDSSQGAGTQLLLCNIGTGISLATMDAQGEVERISGSGIGGTTFWALVKRLTKFTSFDQALVAGFQSGEANKADTLVEDIYGRETSKEIGLPPDLVAGFLGKLDREDLSDADVAAALLRMLVSNVGQLAVFQARLLKVDTVWFTGGFVQSVGSQDHGGVDATEIAQQAVTEAVSFWSAGAVHARFPPNAALLGAMGAIHIAP
ncbi:hypothetical protein IWW51_001070 [Coemansia sp. RSA 2702]|nr:hypothetical protein IWW54_001316 [Coemansia sp. RSA 2705]KAJ2328662.1 hypothetical protein IWW51_001070 [Coemansia sp. RSA 2702]